MNEETTKPKPAPRRKKLTDQQRVFVEAYVGECRFNGTKAAEVAGYSDPNAWAWQVRALPHVRELIDERLAQMTMSANEVLARLDEQARLDLSEFFDFEAYSEEAPHKTKFIPVFNHKRAEESGKMHLIAGFEYGKNSELIVRFNSSLEALTLLGKAMKLFVDRTEHSGKIDLTGLSDEELERIAAGQSPR